MAMTRKDFWIQAYLSLVPTHGPKDAVPLADEALFTCDERWRTPEVRASTQLMADAEVGQPDYSQKSKIFQRPAKKKD